MGRKKFTLLLDTSIRITYPGMNPMEFSSIEEAEEAILKMSRTNPRIKVLSALALKMRANKYSSASRIIPKDNILCEWLDDHTIRYYRAKSSKSKGSNWEYNVRNALKKMGYRGATTSRGESKNADNNNIDIVDLDHKLPINIQCKAYKSCPDYNTIRQGCDDAKTPFIVAWHCSQPDDYFKVRKNKDLNIPIEKNLMLVPAEFFYELLDAYTKYNNIL